jgi:hypothetical protein
MSNSSLESKDGREQMYDTPGTHEVVCDVRKEVQYNYDAPLALHLAMPSEILYSELSQIF